MSDFREKERRADGLQHEIKKEIAELHLIMTYGRPDQKERARGRLASLEKYLAGRLRDETGGRPP